MIQDPAQDIPPTEEEPIPPAAEAEAVESAVAPEPPPVAPARRPLVKRHHGIVRFAHWANTVLLLGMIASGLQIYMAFSHFGIRGSRYYPNPWDGKPFPEGARLGGGRAGGVERRL